MNSTHLVVGEPAERLALDAQEQSLAGPSFDVAVDVRERIEGRRRAVRRLEQLTGVEHRPPEAPEAAIGLEAFEERVDRAAELLVEPRHRCVHLGEAQARASRPDPSGSGSTPTRHRPPNPRGRSTSNTRSSWTSRPAISSGWTAADRVRSSPPPSANVSPGPVVGDRAVGDGEPLGPPICEMVNERAEDLGGLVLYSRNNREHRRRMTGEDVALDGQVALVGRPIWIQSARSRTRRPSRHRNAPPW